MCRYLCLDMCGEHGCGFVCYVLIDCHSLQCSVRVLLGCRGQSGKNSYGSQPVSPGPTCVASLSIVHRHRSSTKWNCRAKGLGWEGGGLKREVRAFLTEGEMEGKQDRGASLHLPPSSGRLTRQGP